MDGVAAALPALTRAKKLQARAARAGFDWDDAEGVMDKIREELNELERAVRDEEHKGRVEEELGDLLFSVVNLARHLDVDPEQALRGANRKFERRFRALEARARAEGAPPEALDAAALERHWAAVKAAENAPE
jgi:ATP diphosphatase